MRKCRMQCFGTLLALVCSMAVLAEPAPTVYTLGTRVNSPCGMDIDQFGRIVLVDGYRQAVMRFEMDGRLDRLWYYADTRQTNPGDSWVSVSIRPDGKAYISPANGYRDPLRLLDLDNLSCCDVVPPSDYWYYTIAATADGGFYTCVHVDNPKSKTRYAMHVHSPDGKLTKEWGCPYLADFAVTQDGRVYGSDGDADNIVEYSPEGKLLGTFSVPGRSGRIAIDANGDIYAARHLALRDRFIDQIIKISSDGKSQHVVKGYGTPGTIVFIRHLAVHNGLLFAIVEWHTHIDWELKWEIQVLTLDGQCVARYVPPAAAKYDLPGAIAVHQDGTYAVQKIAEEKALLFNADDSLVATMLGCHFGSLAPGPDGGYYAAGGIGLSLYDKTGKLVRVLIKYGTTTESFITDDVQYITRIPDNHLWGVTCSYPVNEIFEFGPDDKLLRRVRTSDELWPGEIAVDARGYVYCTSWWPGNALPSRNNIAQYDLNGKRIGTIGKKGSGIGELKGNNGMALDSSGRLYVADTGNSRIQVFTSSGQSLGAWIGPADKRLCRPLGVAMGPNETLWITDTFNDRIVRVPLAQFWQQISKIATPEPAPEIIVKTPLPASGKTSVTAVVIAGTDDFADAVYVESSDRTWGLCVRLPVGAALLRGERCQLGGVLSANARALTADSVKRLENARVPGPLGTANLYVGDGFRTSARKTDLSNICLLVRTWGRVVSVDSKNQVFIINDGSYSGETAGLAVYFGSVRKPISALPKIGQYVAVTGVSTTWLEPGGRHVPAVRIRDDADIQVLAVE